MSPWTSVDIPSQTGRLAIVTGTGGLGYETALTLAASGADVIIAGRNSEKGADAVAKIRKLVDSANVKFELVDLASLKSIDEFGKRFCAQYDTLDLLVNNAAVMTPPKRLKTEDDFELQFGTNYLGHFALTAALLAPLSNAKNVRVVSLSSVASRNGKIDFNDLQAERNYNPMRCYSQSKLACLMFALELQRRSNREGWGITSIAAHPGISRTELLHNAPGKWSVAGISRSLLWFLFQPAAQGALPSLFASTSPEAKGGEYYGPDGMSEIRGYPTKAKIPDQALIASDAARLWNESEKLTGVNFRSARVL